MFDVDIKILIVGAAVVFVAIAIAAARVLGTIFTSTSYAGLRVTGPAGQTVPLPELVLFLHDVDDAAGVQPPPAEGTSLPATAKPAKGLWPYPARTRPPGNDHQRSGAKTVEPTSAEGVAAEAPGASIRERSG